MADKKELVGLLAILAVITAWSWVNPYDRVTWWMEALPVFIGLAVLMPTYSRFPLTRLSYYLVTCHAIVLLVGAHYTYARVPVGDWVQHAFDMARNNYDRFAHVVQGFVPAILAREVLLRLQVVKPGGWLFFLVCCFCLAFSAFYELVEWWSAILGGDNSLEFLGVQGDIWDAQWDMMLALIGAILAQLLLAGVHGRQLEKVQVLHVA